MAKLHLTYEFEDEAEMRAWMDGRTEAPASVAETAPTPAPVAETITEGSPTRTDVDSDGMPWNEAVHSDPPSFKADGTWRAKRGAADEEKQARAAFKAAGGNVQAPDTSAAPAPTMPGLPGAAPAANTLPEPTPEPISFDKMVEKLTGMMTRGIIDNAKVNELYKVHGGADPVTTLTNNETARAALFADLCQIEPELA